MSARWSHGAPTLVMIACLAAACEERAQPPAPPPRPARTDTITWALRSAASAAQTQAQDNRDRQLMVLEIESAIGSTESGPLSFDGVFGSDPGSAVVRATPETQAALARFRDAATAGLGVFAEYKRAHPELLAESEVRGEINVLGSADGTRVENRWERNRELARQFLSHASRMGTGWAPLPAESWNSLRHCLGFDDDRRHHCNHEDLTTLNQVLAWNRAFAVRDTLDSVTSVLGAAPGVRVRYVMNAVVSRERGEANRGGRLSARIGLYSPRRDVPDGVVVRVADDVRARVGHALSR